MADIFDRITSPEEDEGDAFDRVSGTPSAIPPKPPMNSWGASRAAQAEGTMNLLEGAGKGVIDTATNLARLPAWTGNWIGQIPAVRRFVNDPGLPEALEPTNTPQKAGKFMERVGEFALGEGAVAAGAKAIPWLTRLMNAAPRTANIAKNAVVGGGVTAAQGGDPVVGAALGGGMAALGEIAGPLARALKESALKSYARTMASKATMKNVSQRVVGGYDVAGQHMPGLVERGTVAATRKGLAEKATREVEMLGDQIDALWQTIPPGQKVPAAQIDTAIKTARDSFMQTGPAKTMTVAMKAILPTDTIVRVNAATNTAVVQRAQTVAIEPAAVKSLERVQRLIANLTDDQGLVDVHQLRRVKQVFDTVVAGKGGYAGQNLSIADSAGVLARKEAANAIREELANARPDIASINRQFHFWKDVETVLGETLKRTAGQSQPMGQQIAKIAGTAAMGKAGAAKALLTGEALGLFRKLTTSAAWNTTSAVAKDRLAELIAAGNGTQATLLMRGMLAGASTATDKHRGAIAPKPQPVVDAAIQRVADRHFNGDYALAEKYLRSKGAL